MDVVEGLGTLRRSTSLTMPRENGTEPNMQLFLDLHSFCLNLCPEPQNVKKAPARTCLLGMTFPSTCSAS